MSEVASESPDVLPKPCGVMSCDANGCPSPPPPPCDGKEDEYKKKPEQQKQCNQVQPKKKVKAKGKLVRSVAVCEEPSTFEETQTYPDANISLSCQDDEISSCKEEEQEKSTDPKKPSSSLSKESSVEYTDSTGIDLHQFIVDTLNSNPRDRMMLLKLEQDMIDFITSNSPFKKFPHMSSYHRMLVHRVAAYFGMEHNVDQTGKSVIINRTSSTRIPEQRFLDEVHKDKAEEIQQWRIMKREKSSDDQGRLHPLLEKQSKSMEEREEEYQRARERIFKKEPSCAQESGHAETRDVEDYNPYAETQRRRQLFWGSRDSSGSSWTGSSRQSSTETDCRYGNDPQPWSSTDSDSSHQWTTAAPKARQAVNCHSWDARGSGSIALFRLPSHPSPPPILEEPAPNSAYIAENGIPPGSILVNPHTGQPFLNPDGTPAVYNPPDSQQPIRSQSQQQPQQQVVQYSSVSYTAPQMLPVTPSQPYSTMEDLSSQFAHVTVSCQSAGEAPPLYPPGQGYIYAAPPLAPPPPNPSGYCQPSPQVRTHASSSSSSSFYHDRNHFKRKKHLHQLRRAVQVPVYYYGQFPTSAQQGCRPVSPTQHAQSQAAQPTGGYAPAVRVQQSSHTQPQAVLGTYSPVASHQCSMVQGGVPVSFPQSKVVAGPGGEAGYCCIVAPPSSHHATCLPPSCAGLSAPAWSAQY